ncbi:MAG: EF-P lysine aminoacylase EpmA [Candidatus Nanoarchaeia archaeon]
MNTPNASAKPEKIALLKNSRSFIELRALALRAVRDFFFNNGYLEVETPVRIASPAPETHIDPILSESLFLRTSPELQMKQMLCAGYEKIFQIGPCFRKGEIGRIHNEEFTMLEWYQTGSDYLDLLNFTKKMIAETAKKVLKTEVCEFRGQKIDLSPESWQIFSVEEAFAKFAGIGATEAIGNGIFDQILVEKVEPNLPKNSPVVLIDYPAELAAFAKLKNSTPQLAERWELYIGGVELSNTYSELTDYQEQKARFAKFAEERAALGKETPPFDEDFLSALRYGMPKCAGSALGFDRLVMIFANAPDIKSVRT